MNLRRLFHHEHRYKQLPGAFGYSSNPDGTINETYTVQVCRCGAQRKQPASGIYLPRAILEPGKELQTW